MPCPFTGPKMFWAGPIFLCQTNGSNWIKIDKISLKLTQIDQTGSNWTKLDQNVQNRSNWFKRDQTGSNLIKFD